MGTLLSKEIKRQILSLAGHSGRLANEPRKVLNAMKFLAITAAFTAMGEAAATCPAEG